MATSSNSPLICVNRKNFIAAKPRFSCPQIAIRKYMGTSITSQKKKNRNRSRAVKTPTTPARVHSRLNWKNPARSVTSVQDAATATAPSSTVSATIIRLKPSIDRITLMPNWGIHGAFIAE